MIDVSKIFYPTLTLPDILGSHCVGRVPRLEASGVREPDFLISPQYIGGTKGGNNSIKITTYHFSNNLLESYPNPKSKI
jgi:hypothetical protein